MAKLKNNQFYLPSGAIITELPILFSTEMVQAILADRKSQTRRDRNLDLVNEHPEEWELCWVGDTVVNNRLPKVFGVMFQHRTFPDKVVFIKSPFGKPGDLLYVKETWATIGVNSVCFKAGIRPGLFTDRMRSKYKSSLHLRKADSRIWLMIEEIRVERVQDINSQSALKEGIKDLGFGMYKYYGTGDKTPNPRSSFQSLWVFINGSESWNSNPWVWVIRYRILSKTGRPSLKVIEEAYQDVTNPPRVSKPLEGSAREEAHHG